MTGRYPGPPLWKVSAGTHELWIFGTLPVIPKDITWGSVLVERVIARADEMLLPPGVDAAARNPFRYVGLFFRVRKLTRNEDGAPLKDVLPADLYARYATIRERYDGPRSLEQERPVVVAGRLYARAIDASNLTFGGKLQSSIERLARDAHVKRTDTEVRADPGDLLDAAQALSRQAEIDCFATVLASIENDLPGIAERATSLGRRRHRRAASIRLSRHRGRVPIVRWHVGGLKRHAAARAGRPGSTPRSARSLRTARPSPRSASVSCCVPTGRSRACASSDTRCGSLSGSHLRFRLRGR